MRRKEALTVASIVMAIVIVFFIGVGIFLFQYYPTQKTTGQPQIQNQVQNKPQDISQNVQQNTAAQQANNAPTINPADGNLIYKNSQYGFEFEYPNTWRIISSNENGLVASFLRGAEAQDDILDIVLMNGPITQAEGALPYPYAPAIKIPVSSVENLELSNIYWTKLVYPSGYGITDQLAYKNGTTYAFQYLTNYSAEVKLIFNTFKFEN